MDPNTVTLIWLLAGTLLMISEIFVPGLVVIFLGMSVVLVAALRWTLGLENLAINFLLWGILSGALVYAMRHVAGRLVKSERQSIRFTEDEEAIGAEVEVVETCTDDSKNGRILYQGTTWSATTLNGTLHPGKRAKLLYRDNLVWIIEAADPLDIFDIDGQTSEAELEVATPSHRHQQQHKK